MTLFLYKTIIHHMKRLFITLFTIIITSTLILGCTKKTTTQKSIAVFVPGICDDSPIYAMLVKGVTQAVEEFNSNQTLADSEKISLFVMEAGTNQAEWGAKITALVAENKYDVIISSNPSLPDLVEPILQQFPNQKFILLDATKDGNQNIHTVCYNQYEQSFVTGYISGLMSKTHRLALIAAQEYPVMNNIILPYYEKGAIAANEDSTVDFRIVGNWYDATKGSEIADAVYKNGVDVILPICGGASQGVLQSAKNNGIYVAWFDDDGFTKAPGTIICSTKLKQQEMSYLVTKEFIEEKTPWGQAKMVGFKEGFIEFDQTNPHYIENTPEDIREKMSVLIQSITEGKININ